MASPNPAVEVPLSLGDRVYVELKTRFSEFQILPGDRLSELELSDELKTSRTPVRQALQRLSLEGLMTLVPRVGWIVPEIDFSKIDFLYDFRVLIECHAGLTACNKREHPSLRNLTDIWSVHENDRATEPELVAKLDEQFHRTLVSLVENPEILRVYDDLIERIRLVRRLDFLKQNRVHATYQEHQKILKSILSAKREETTDLIRAHIEASKAEVRKITVQSIQSAREKRRLYSEGRKI
jgi:DNA-binding GntR family transcriptional regulator